MIVHIICQICGIQESLNTGKISTTGRHFGIAIGNQQPRPHGAFTFHGILVLFKEQMYAQQYLAYWFYAFHKVLLRLGIEREISVVVFNFTLVIYFAADRGCQWREGPYHKILYIRACIISCV